MQGKYTFGENSEVLEHVQSRGSIFGMASVDDGGLQFNTPITGFTEYMFSSRKKWNYVRNGEEDCVPNFHRQLYRDSLYHNSIINSKAQIAYGEGLEFYVPENTCKVVNGQLVYVENNFSDGQKKQLIQEAELWSKRVLLDTYFKKALQQIFTYGGYYGLRFYSRDESGNSMLDNVMIEPYFNMRLGTEREFILGGHHSKYMYISDDFSRNKFPSEPMTYNQFRAKGSGIARVEVDRGRCIEDNKKGVFARHVARVTDYRNYYATADWESRKAVNAICLDYALSLHDKSKILNGFTAEYIVVKYRKKAKTEAEEKEIKRQEIESLKGGYKGVQGSRIMLMWAEPTFNADNEQVNNLPMEIIPIPQAASDRVKSIRDNIACDILIAHGISIPEAFGFKGETNGNGMASQSEYLRVGLEQSYNMRIKPMIQFVQDDVNQLLSSCNHIVQVRVKKKLPLQKIQSDELIKCSTTINELRAARGDEPIENGDRLIQDGNTTTSRADV